MSSDYIPRLRRELLRAGAAEQSRWRRARVGRGLRPLAAAAAAVALVAVAVVLALPDRRSDEASVEPPAGALTLTYRVERAGAATTERTAQVMRDRLAAAGVQDAGVSVSAGGSLTITAPARAREDVTALAQSGRLAIYDWERGVLGPRGVPAPADASVTGGPDAGRAAAITNAEAEERAAGPPGGQVVRALSTVSEGWFALGGEPALTTADIESAVAEQSPEPIVAIELTARGQTAFEALTRRLARRGSDVEALQHLAIVLDDRIVAMPFIDYREAPNGVDGSEGALIAGGLTVQTARQIAALLSTGPLPADLVLEPEDAPGG